jgi:hypothetical protein
MAPRSTNVLIRPPAPLLANRLEVTVALTVQPENTCTNYETCFFRTAVVTKLRMYGNTYTNLQIVLSLERREHA